MADAVDERGGPLTFGAYTRDEDADRYVGMALDVVAAGSSLDSPNGVKS